jgi:hypothetical protein
LCLTPPTPSSAQVELDKDTNRIVQAAGDVAKAIPYVGPFLSGATKLIFRAKKEPSYAEMKLEWEGYTDNKILEYRKTDLKNTLTGYRNLIDEIDNIRKHETELNESEANGANRDEARHKRYNYEKIEKWKAIGTRIVGDLPKFNFEDPNQPVAPLLPMYGAVINLRLDAYDRIAKLAEKYDRGLMEERQKDAEKWKNDYNEKLVKLIIRAAKERVAKLVVTGHDAKYTEVNTSGDQLDRSSKMRVEVRPSEWWVSDQGILKGKVYKTKREAESAHRELRRWIRDEFTCRNNRDYELKSYTWIQIAGLPGKNGEKSLRDEFSKFGTVEYIEPGKAPDFHSYIQMKRADANEAIAYFNSPEHNFHQDASIGRAVFWKKSVTENRKHRNPCGAESAIRLIPDESFFEMLAGLINKNSTY